MQRLSLPFPFPAASRPYQGRLQRLVMFPQVMVGVDSSSTLPLISLINFSWITTKGCATSDHPNSADLAPIRSFQRPPARLGLGQAFLSIAPAITPPSVTFRLLPAPSLLPKTAPIGRGTLKNVQSRLDALQGNSEELSECSTQQRWQTSA